MATVARKPAVERQHDLLAAALERFAEDGFDGASVQDIAHRAGMATGTVYLYFPSKEHLLLGLHAQFHEGLADVLVQLVDQFRERIEAGETVDVAEASDRIVDALVHYSVEHRAHCAVLTTHLSRRGGDAASGASEDTFGGLLGSILEDATERGLVDLVHPRIAARLLSTATIQTIGPAVTSGDADHLRHLTDQTKQIFRKVLT